MFVGLDVGYGHVDTLSVIPKRMSGGRKVSHNVLRFTKARECLRQITIASEAKWPKASRDVLCVSKARECLRQLTVASGAKWSKASRNVLRVTKAGECLRQITIAC